MLHDPNCEAMLFTEDFKNLNDSFGTLECSTSSFKISEQVLKNGDPLNIFCLHFFSEEGLMRTSYSLHKYYPSLGTDLWLRKILQSNKTYSTFLAVA